MHKKPETASAARTKKQNIGEDIVNMLVEGLRKLRLKGWLIFAASIVICYVVLQHYRAIGEMFGFNPWMCLLILFLPFSILCISAAYNGGGAKEEDDIFRSIGLTNALGETPELISKKKNEKNPREEIREYDSESISVLEWQNKRSKLEAAFNCSVTFIAPSSHSKQRVEIGMIGGEYSIPTNLLWDDDMIPGVNIKEEEDTPKGGKLRQKMHELNQVQNNDLDRSIIHKPDKGFTVVLGEGITGPITVDLDSLPHVIIGGTTGSGKSVLLRSVLWQAIVKGARVCIVDFKGGVEFSGPWEDFSRIYTNRTEAITMMDSLRREMEMRFELFKRCGNSKNLMDYNRNNPHDKLSRIVLACDEVGSMLNSKGASKEDKADLKEIEKNLMELAMKSRAAGINMILATQRPDAETLPGQLRSNLPVRICGQVGGKAGLSEIVLDDPIAATISARQRGRFYTNVNPGGMTEFQGYYFIDEKHMTPGNYQEGRCLVLPNETGAPSRDYIVVDEEQEAARREVEMGEFINASEYERKPKSKTERQIAQRIRGDAEPRKTLTEELDVDLDDIELK